MICKKCSSSHIVNKFHSLCLDCNNLRLHGSKYGKQYDTPVRQFKPSIKPKRPKKSRINAISDRAKDVIRKDEETYEKVFNLSDHKCEECQCELNDEFRDSDGKVAFRSRYSHIIPKSIAPTLRHNVDNFNNLCQEHHDMWENGCQEKMRIFKKNTKTICRLRKLH